MFVRYVGPKFLKWRAVPRNEAERRRANEGNAAQAPLPIPNAPSHGGHTPLPATATPASGTVSAASLPATPAGAPPEAEDDIPIEAILSGGSAGNAPAPAAPAPLAWSGVGKVQQHFEACERELLELVLRYGECPVIVPPDPV